MLFPSPSPVMLVLKAGPGTSILIPAGVFTPLSHPVTFCLSLVGLTLFSALLLLGCSGTLGDFLLCSIMEARSPHGFIKQQ